MKKRKNACRFLLVALMGLASASLGSGFGSPSPIGIGTSGPTTQDPAALYWNPGWLGFDDQIQLLVGTGLVLGDIGYQRDRRATYQKEDSLVFALPVPPQALDLSKTGRTAVRHSKPLVPVPSLFLSVPFAMGEVPAAWGVGVFAPYAALLDFDTNGPQRWSIQQATIASIYISPVLSVRLHPRFSIGAGVSYVLGFAELSRIQDFGAVADMGAALRLINQTNDFGPTAPPAVRELAVMARPFKLVNAWAHGATFHVGLAYQPLDILRFGLTYHHGVDLDFQGEFSLDMNHDYFTKDLAFQGLKFPKLILGEASLTFPLPRSILFGASLQVGKKLELSFRWDLVFWSAVQAFRVKVQSDDLAQPSLGISDTVMLSIPKRWKDSINMALCARIQWTERFANYFSAGYQSSAVPDSTINVDSPDGNRLVFGLGGSLRLTPNLALMADAQLQTILPREVVGSDYDLGNGTYNLMLLALGLSVQVDY